MAAPTKSLQGTSWVDMAALRTGSVLITGANRGIGLELVRQLLDLPHPPHTLIATCRRPSEAAALLALQRTRQQTLHVLQYDVAASEQHATLATDVSRILAGSGGGGLNVLINNAGILTRAMNLEQVTEELMMREYAVNAVGPMMTTKALLPLLERAAGENQALPVGFSRAAIVYLSSFLASITLNTTGGVYPYRPSKAALNILMKNVAIEVEKKGIFVMALHPGWVATDMGTQGGTVKAPVSVQQSVAGMLAVLSKADASRHGSFHDYQDKPMPW